MYGLLCYLSQYKKILLYNYCKIYELQYNTVKQVSTDFEPISYSTIIN